MPSRRLPSPPRTLGEHLLVARYERGLRQKDASREIGVDEFTLGNWESGRTSPVLRNWPAIYWWLGYCPVDRTPLTLGRRLVAWRVAQGLSQDEQARRLGIDAGTLGRAERGRNGNSTRRIREAIESLLRLTESHAACPNARDGDGSHGPTP